MTKWLDDMGLTIFIVITVIAMVLLVYALARTGANLDFSADMVDGIATRCRIVPEGLEVVASSSKTIVVYEASTRHLYTMQIDEFSVCESQTRPISSWDIR